MYTMWIKIYNTNQQELKVFELIQICTEFQVAIVCFSMDLMQLQWNTMIVCLNKSYFINYMHRSKLYLYLSRGNNVILSLLQMHNEMPFILHDVSRGCVAITHNHHTVVVYNILRVICDSCGLIIYMSSRIDAYVLFYNLRSQLEYKNA